MHANENELMDYFHLLVDEFRKIDPKIEVQQFCVVNGKKYTVY
jgi:hypothetical protein